MTIRPCSMLLVSALVVTAILVRAVWTAGEITHDGSLQPRAPNGLVTGPGFVVPAAVGEVRRNNLFYIIWML